MGKCTDGRKNNGNPRSRAFCKKMAKKSPVATIAHMVHTLKDGATITLSVTKENGKFRLSV